MSTFLYLTNSISLTNPLNNPSWDTLVNKLHNPCFFHTSAWAKVLYSTYGYRPLYMIKDIGDNLEILFPLMEVDSFLTGKRGVSLPFTDFCPILCPNRHFFHELLKKVIDYGRSHSWRYLELRGGSEFLGKKPINSFFYVHQINIDRDIKKIFLSLRSSTRRNIKKAEKVGVKISFSKDFDSIKVFYRLHCITRKRHGMPPQSFSFFQNIYKYIISDGKGLIINANYNGKVIASAIYFFFGHQAIYKFGASDMKFQNLRANNLVMWKAIKYFAKKKELKIFNFGRTEPGNKGLLQFKKGWGAEEKICNYYRYDFKVDTFVPGRLISSLGIVGKVMGKLPIPILQLIGRSLYPHIA